MDRTKDLVFQSDAKKMRKPRFKKVEHSFAVEPRTIQVVKKAKTFVDHSYRDFSMVPPDVKYEEPKKISQMSFSQKLYEILDDESLSSCITWMPHGRAFKILIPKALEQLQVLQKFYGHNRYSSFLRQLNNYGFKHITKGPDRNSYYHECFLRHMKHLLFYMPAGRDARRAIPDPENEPDFYVISRLYPLPDAPKAYDSAKIPEAVVKKETEDSKVAATAEAKHVVPLSSPSSMTTTSVPRVNLAMQQQLLSQARVPALQQRMSMLQNPAAVPQQSSASLPSNQVNEATMVASLLRSSLATAPAYAPPPQPTLTNDVSVLLRGALSAGLSPPAPVVSPTESALLALLLKSRTGTM